ncbi:MAG TPA: outer membrane protein assembly factor BamD [Terriglobales bacterium]|nr:outer membrane protein assembly factor BamD [Terriglobales bacterium]
MSRVILGVLFAATLLGAVGARADENTERAVCVRSANLYLSPDTNSQKLATVDRGREVAVLEHSGSRWVHVLASLGEARDAYGEGERDVSGWMLDKGLVRKATPNGDQILFGEAADSEAEAERRGGRRGADKDALRLYYRVAEYFPNSPLAGEAAYRSADIAWQLDVQDMRSRPSAKEKDPYMRHQMDEDQMKKVEKKYPNTKWADLAAFDLIDNKLCGDWEGDPKCPEKESSIYEKYVEEHPQSPKAAEALYDAAWRQSALIEIYTERNDGKKADESRAKALELAQRASQQYPNSDYAYRAQRLIFLLQQKIPTYGNVTD